MFKISKHKKQLGVNCCAYGCSNEPISKKGGLCHKHYRRKRRESDPVSVRYNQFKANSTRRGVKNTITIDQFRSFCKKTGYIVKKGNRGQNATIDRMCNTHGYHIWNIQLLTNRQNAYKGAKNSDNFDCPF